MAARSAKGTIVIVPNRIAKTGTSEKRQYRREPVACVLSVAWIRHGSRLLPAIVHDESPGGVAVLVKQPPKVSVGERVVLDRLLRDVESFSAIVRHVDDAGEDQWRIGLEWCTANW